MVRIIPVGELISAYFAGFTLRYAVLRDPEDFACILGSRCAACLLPTAFADQEPAEFGSDLMNGMRGTHPAMGGEVVSSFGLENVMANEVHLPTDTLARLRMLEELCSRRTRLNLEYRRLAESAEDRETGEE